MNTSSPVAFFIGTVMVLGIFGCIGLFVWAITRLESCRQRGWKPDDKSPSELDY